MRKQLLFIYLTVCLVLTATLPAFSQQKTSILDKITNFPSRFFEKLQKDASAMEEKLIERSSKALKKLAKQEARLKKKLAKKDSLAAAQVFGTGAAFSQRTTGSTINTSAGIDFSLKGMSYDANGNLLSMTHKGWKLGGSVTIDSLQYTYENNNNSNKLKNVIDRVNDTAPGWEISEALKNT